VSGDPHVEGLVAEGPWLARVEGLGPRSRETVAAAIDLAQRLHAEEVTIEHLVVAMMRDESLGATRLVLSAFADPETIAAETLALCPGILVVGSGRTLPFSVLGVRAIEAARRTAHERGAATVGTGDVFTGAVDLLPPGVAPRLEAAGLRRLARPREGASDPVPDSGPLFQRFSSEARRGLGGACRLAGSLGAPAISPNHLLVAALEADPTLARATELSASRARALLADAPDETPVPRRPLPPGPGLRRLMEEVPPGAETGRLLENIVAGGGEEIRLLLAQQRIGPELLRHALARHPD